MRRVKAFIRKRLSVCLYLCDTVMFWKPWPREFFLGVAGTCSESSGQGCISRSLGQGQGHRSQKAWNLILPHCDRHGAVSLHPQWRKVHFSHSASDAAATRVSCADFKFSIRRQRLCFLFAGGLPSTESQS